MINNYYNMIEEELNILYGEHELTSAYAEDIILWFERQRISQMQISSLTNKQQKL